MIWTFGCQWFAVKQREMAFSSRSAVMGFTAKYVQFSQYDCGQKPYRRKTKSALSPAATPLRQLRFPCRRRHPWRWWADLSVPAPASEENHHTLHNSYIFSDGMPMSVGIDPPAKLFPIGTVAVYGNIHTPSSLQIGVAGNYPFTPSNRHTIRWTSTLYNFYLTIQSSWLFGRKMT